MTTLGGNDKPITSKELEDYYGREVDETELEEIRKELQDDHDIFEAVNYCDVYFDRDICEAIEPFVFANLESQSKEALIGLIVKFRNLYFKKIDSYIDDKAQEKI